MALARDVTANSGATTSALALDCLIGRQPGPVGAKPRLLNDPLEATLARTAAGRKNMLGLPARPCNGQTSSNTAASYM